MTLATHHTKAPAKRRATPRKTSAPVTTKSNGVIASELKHLESDVRELAGDVKELRLELSCDLKDMRTTVEKINSRFTLFFGLGIGAMAASGLIKEGAKEVLIKLLGVF